MEKNRRNFLKKAGALSAGVGVLPWISLESYAQEDNTSQSCNPCTLDYYGEGPFYTQNPPDMVNGQLAESNEPGERMIIKGRVTNLDCTEFIEGAIIDVWHADDSGAYDNVGFKLRGKVTSDSQGYYQFETIKPGKYLNGAQFRPSHIHFKITAPGKPVFTTQLYFQGDTSIANDAAASIDSGTYDATHRIIALNQVDGKWKGVWDIAVAGDGELIETGVSSVHLDKGMIYKAFPNPFDTELQVKFGVFKPAQVAISLFDLAGNRVAFLEQKYLDADIYELQWEPSVNLSPGNYVLAIAINDLQVHTMKVVKS